MAELDPTTFRPETRALHSGQKPDPTTNARAVPIYATTSYVFDDAAHAARLFGLQEFGNIYTRIMNPTTDVFEQRVAALEGGVAALGVSLRPGGRDAVDPQPRPRRRQHRVVVVAVRRHLQPVHPHAAEDRHHHDLRRRLRSVGLRAGDQRARPRRSSSSSSATRASTSTTSPRSPTWPTPGACRSSSTTRSRRSSPSRSSTARTSSSTARRSGSAATARPSAASSSTAGRSTGRPASASRRTSSTRTRRYHGISYTAAFGNLAFILKLRVQGLRDIGAALSPFNAFLFLQGLETLPLRITRHSENALAVAKWLETRPEVTWVSYPGLESHPSHKLAKRT